MLRSEIPKLGDGEGNSHPVQEVVNAIVGERARKGIISNDIVISSM